MPHAYLPPTILSARLAWSTRLLERTHAPRRPQAPRRTAVRPRDLEGGVAPDRAPGLAGDGLLQQEGGGGEHGEAAVRELLLLHLAELGGVLGLEAERVEAEVARVVAGAEGGLRLELLAVQLTEAGLDAERLGGADAAEHHEPDGRGQLQDLLDGGAAVGGEERVELLLHDEAKRSQHRHAAVRQLRLAEAEHLELALALHEAGRVPLAEDVAATGQAVGEGDLLLSLLGAEAAELHAHVGRRAHGGTGEGGRGDGGEREHGCR